MTTWNRDFARAAGVFTVSFVACASFILCAKPLPVTDEFLTYYRIAKNIAVGKGFTEDGITPMVYFPPLFSAMLGGWFFVTRNQSVFTVQMYQALCIAASAAASYFLFKEVFNDGKSARSPSMAAAWIAVHPSLWSYTVFVRQEPTILLFTTTAAWANLRWFRHPGATSAALAGIAWGLATLSKTVTIFIPAFLLAFWLLYKDRIRSVPLREVAVAIISFILVIAPWTARNYRYFHRVIPVNDQGAGILEWNVQHSDAPADEGKNVVALLVTLLGTKDATRGALAGEKYLSELDKAGLTGDERNKELWKYISAHKKYFLVQRLRNAVFFAAPGIDWWLQHGVLGMGEAQKNPVFWILALLFHVPFYVFLLYRCIQLCRGNLEPARAFLALFYICYWGTYTLLWGEIRFSLPVYPVLVAMAPWDRIRPG